MRKTSALTEKLVRDTLIKTKGDLIQTAEKIGIWPSKLVTWIKSVPSVAAVWGEIEKVKQDPSFENATQAQFAAEIRSRATLYRLDGLDVLHELATTDHAGEAAMADVRFKAALALRGEADSMPAAGGDIMAELNELYRKSAPRIKALRAVEIEFDAEPASLKIPG